VRTDYYDDDVELEETGAVESEEEFTEEFMASLRVIAKESLRKFFQGKQMHYGANITDSFITSNYAVEVLMTAELEPAVVGVYRAMERKGYKQKKLLNGMVEEQMIVLGVLKKCAKLKIPKVFRAGILLLYVELCHGIKVLK
jgi:hypothetical protein